MLKWIPHIFILKNFCHLGEFPLNSRLCPASGSLVGEPALKAEKLWRSTAMWGCWDPWSSQSLCKYGFVCLDATNYFTLVIRKPTITYIWTYKSNKPQLHSSHDKWLCLDSKSRPPWFFGNCERTEPQVSERLWVPGVRGTQRPSGGSKIVAECPNKRALVSGILHDLRLWFTLW